MARTDKQGTKPTGPQATGEERGPAGRSRKPAGDPATQASAGGAPNGQQVPDTAAEDEQAPAAAEKPALSAFAAAIERKKAAGQARSAHLDGSTKVGGATSNHKTTRTFRRKSG